MTKQETAFSNLASASVTRRHLLKAGVAAGVTAAGLAAPSETAAQNVVHPRIIRVDDVRITFIEVAAPSVPYFLTIGNISELNGLGVSGTFYCRGCVTNPAALGLPPLIDSDGIPLPVPSGATFVDQRFRIDNFGQIYGSGDEFDRPMLVVGGIGAFREVRGTYQPDDGLPIPLGGGTIIFTFEG